PSPTCAGSAGEGKFSIDVVSDVYKLEVTGPPGGKLIPQWASGRLSSGDADLVDVRAADADGIRVTMIKGVLLTGVVRGPSGPIEDAQICTRTLAAPLPWDCERSKKNGSYLVLVEPGRYFMWTVPPDNTRLLAQWYDGVLQGVDTTDINIDRDTQIDVMLGPGPQLRGKVTTTDTDISGTYSLVVPPGTYQVEVFAPFRGERGDLLSQPARELVVKDFVRYDVVLEDAKP